MIESSWVFAILAIIAMWVPIRMTMKSDRDAVRRYRWALEDAQKRKKATADEFRRQ